MTNDTNIRQFPGAEVPEQTLSVEREPFGYCAHDKISLDEHNRTVKCRSRPCPSNNQVERTGNPVRSDA